MQLPEQLNITNRNSQLPFYTSLTWSIVEADKDKLSLPKVGPFIWIQAFFNASSITVIPQLAVYSGVVDGGGNPIVSRIRFAYSGERINFKGQAIMSSGTDIRGEIVTSTVIGADPTQNLLEVIVFGGAY